MGPDKRTLSEGVLPNQNMLNLVEMFADTQKLYHDHMESFD